MCMCVWRTFRCIASAPCNLSITLSHLSGLLVDAATAAGIVEKKIGFCIYDNVLARRVDPSQTLPILQQPPSLTLGTPHETNPPNTQHPTLSTPPLPEAFVPPPPTIPTYATFLPRPKINPPVRTTTPRYAVSTSLSLTLRRRETWYACQCSTRPETGRRSELYG
ncbi:hypothetical protein M011DRAFT_15467 [Sporormia fimetaria CBS 119925]|uniref:Uncharacterized protein n=1 Tax=Sporormia fimetaria CBS 119925 TaxID=1340428 RepID=A0A6A6VQB6_9PLEO|nr:hypothetical protein M011DRAFT_15467 [Sporormia fimetaria CBS 119925]